MTHYILLDLEATCWESDYPKREQEIIELAAVALDPFGKEIDRFERLVRPQIHPYLSHYCTQLTNIEQADVDDAMDFKSCYKDLTAWYEAIDEMALFVAWGHQDEFLIEDACRTYALENFVEGRYLDAKRAYHDMNRISYRIGLKKALKREGMEFEGDHHRAMPDTLNLARLFRKYIGEWPI